MEEDRIYSITLPEKVNGRYWITDIDPYGKKRNIISVEGINGQWVLKEAKKVKIRNQAEGLVSLCSNNIYTVDIEGQNKEAFLFAEEITDSRQIFNKLVVVNNVELTIGRDVNNTIAVQNRFVSSNHAKLVYFNNEWTISDNNSTNGTYVNMNRVTTSKLAPGDIIFIMGFKIIIGSNFIAINDPDNSVTYDKNILYNFQIQTPDMTKERLSEDDLENYYFYRSPRFKREITPMEIKIDPPPQAEKIETTPVALVMGPSITMGMASLSTGAFTVINTISNGGSILTAMPTLVMSVSMLTGMILWPVLTKRHEKKVKKKAEAYRQSKYKDYLFSIKDVILKEIQTQSNILYENNVSVDECINRILSKSDKLWERVIGQDDFLKLRVGLGNIPVNGKITFPDNKFSLENDNLMDELSVLRNEQKKLNMVPVTFSFVDSRVCGIVSPKMSLCEDFVKAMLVRMVALHSYDELKLVFITSEENASTWSNFRCLIHGMTIRTLDSLPLI